MLKKDDINPIYTVRFYVKKLMKEVKEVKVEIDMYYLI